MPSPLSAHVALLRGINVGGNNKLPMKDLAALCTALGCEGVRTFIASGNVIFRARPALLKSLSRKLQAAIARDFQMQVPVVLRSAAELRRVVEQNPFVARGVGPESLYVSFLASTPTAAQIASLAPERSPPDEFAVIGQDLYLHLPNGAARTKLTNAWFDKHLATISTARNWRTTQTLLALAEE